MQLAVAARPVYGANILAVPSTGGSVAAFTVDERNHISTDAQKIGMNATYTAVSVATIGGDLIAAGIDSTQGAAHVALVSPDLKTSTELLKASALRMTEPAIIETDGARVATFADATSIQAWHFDRFNWQPVANMEIAQTDEPAIGLTATSNLDAMYVAWSTQHSCSLARLPGFATPVIKSMDGACGDPHIAIDASGSGIMLFESHGNINISHINGIQMAGDSQLLRGVATSPRLLWDGERYWVSFVNGHGDVEVGFMDSENHVTTQILAGLTPAPGGHELVMIEGAPWVVTIDPYNGYSAHLLCLQSY